MQIPPDYTERVYAGVLGKIIGVYLGRPFEGWTYDRIMAELGEITGYVHQKLGKPLIVTDDDISGTFTFLRALPDYDNRRELTPAQIGQTWLNYIIEQRTILWWGGLGNSTEHTAYLRLKHGIPAPESGSIACNGQVVAEQIGAQIFIDGWGMIFPGDPEQAADFAQRAGSVSHDGEAIYGAQIIAAMEAQAFVEDDLNELLDTAVSFIPKDSLIYRLINDIREWHAEFPDWHTTREQIAAHYGYDRYGGGCHIIPNHALVISSLLYGASDFGQSLMMVNTSGWDTDCNSGNVGCILGIKNGLAGIAPQWRDPVADRLYLSTADGGRAITDAATEAYQVVNVGRALAGELPIAPKDGARFHFELPGSVQGFTVEDGLLTLENAAGRGLAIRCPSGNVGRVQTPTFIPPEAIQMPGYDLMASPTLYPGQTVRAEITADQQNSGTIICRLSLQVYGADDEWVVIYGPETTLAPDKAEVWSWTVPDTGGRPIAAIGLEVHAPSAGTVYLDYLTWDGTPSLIFRRPDGGRQMWRRAWINGVHDFGHDWPEAFRVCQNEGTGLLMQGTRDWKNYRVMAAIVPHLVEAAGLGAYVQGMRRYYALLLVRGGKARLVKALDGEHVLAEVNFDWEFGGSYSLTLEVDGARLRGWVNGQLLLEATDSNRPLTGGGIALICTEGRVATEAFNLSPL